MNKILLTLLLLCSCTLTTYTTDPIYEDHPHSTDIYYHDDLVYFGFWSGENGYFDEKWEGVKNKDNYDINKFEGEFKDGEPNGQGTITFSDGNKGVGEFRENKPWNLTTFDKDGNYKWKYVEGVRRL